MKIGQDSYIVGTTTYVGESHLKPQDYLTQPGNCQAPTCGNQMFRQVKHLNGPQKKNHNVGLRKGIWEKRGENCSIKKI